MIDKIAVILLAMFPEETELELKPKVQAEATVMIRHATQLLATLMSSKALLIPAWPAPTPTCDSWRLEDFELRYLTDDTTEDRSLVIRPSLTKFGNADGENHNLSTTLFKPVLLFY
ncbi:hypothetical protein V2A60_005161 [Cordyceps javanica]